MVLWLRRLGLQRDETGINKVNLLNVLRRNLIIFAVRTGHGICARGAFVNCG